VEEGGGGGGVVVEMVEMVVETTIGVVETAIGVEVEVEVEVVEVELATRVEVEVEIGTEEEVGMEEIGVEGLMLLSSLTTTQLPKPAVVVKDTRHKFPSGPDLQVPGGTEATMSWLPADGGF
jgi:hypothetical protein